MECPELRYVKDMPKLHRLDIRLNTFSNNCADQTKPLHDLLKKDADSKLS